MTTTATRASKLVTRKTHLQAQSTSSRRSFHQSYWSGLPSAQEATVSHFSVRQTAAWMAILIGRSAFHLGWCRSSMASIQMACASSGQTWQAVILPKPPKSFFVQKTSLLCRRRQTHLMCLNFGQLRISGQHWRWRLMRVAGKPKLFASWSRGWRNVFKSWTGPLSRRRCHTSKQICELQPRILLSAFCRQFLSFPDTSIFTEKYTLKRLLVQFNLCGQLNFV